MPFECMGEIEAGLFEWWLGLYPPLLIAIHLANIALNHMNLTSPSSCVIYFHWLSWIVLAIPFPWSLQWVGSYKVVAQFDRFLLGLSCKVQLGDILLQLHERNEIKVEQRLQEATMEVQYFSMVVTSCIFYFLLILSFNILSTTLCVWDPWPIGPTSQVFGAFKENLLQVARSASLAARDSYTRAYQHLLRRVA